MWNMSECWEWCVTTGNPVFPHPPRVPNWRYIPSVEEMSGMVNGLITIDPIRASDLVNFMHSDNIKTHFTFENDVKTHKLKSFMRLLRALNIKKVEVRHLGNGVLTMEKLPRDLPFIDEDKELLNDGGTAIPNIQRKINRNALVGFLGPGTFPCNHAMCHLCARTGRTAAVRLGPHGQLQLTKRGTCRMQNVVYVGVCSKCEEIGGEDDWCVYFGETSQSLSRRCQAHMDKPCSTFNILKGFSSEVRRAKLKRVIEGLDEEKGVLQDWCSHIGHSGIHEGCQRISVVDVLPLRVARINRETGLVLQNMMRDNEIDYRGRGRGCVNTYFDYENKKRRMSVIE